MLAGEKKRVAEGIAAGASTKGRCRRLLWLQPTPASLPPLSTRQAYSFLESKREAATDSCDVERPESCTELDHLNDMAHQLLTTGNVSGGRSCCRTAAVHSAAADDPSSPAFVGGAAHPLSPYTLPPLLLLPAG